MQKIPLNNLAAQHAEIDVELKEALLATLQRNDYIMGQDVRSFEQEFAAFHNVEHAIGVGNGTDALVLGLKALGVGSGDRVIVPVNTFIASSEAVSAVGALPLFVDIDAETMNIDCASLERALADNKDTVKVVMAVHLYGHPAPMERIKSICDSYNVRLIEDAAQAHGAEINGVRVGNFGDFATFSFYPGKNLGALGDAGALITNDHTLAKKVAMLKDHGRTEKYLHEIEGVNSRLDTIQAAALRVKLRKLDAWTDHRISVASSYSSYFNDLEVITPRTSEGYRHVFHLYVIRVKNRDQVLSELKSQGIMCGIHYPIPLHLQPAYTGLGFKKGDFPVAEAVAEEILSLPIDGHIDDSQVKRVVEGVKKSLL